MFIIRAHLLDIELYCTNQARGIPVCIARASSARVGGFSRDGMSCKPEQREPRISAES
jgi:hypothetical protein